jgi:glutathione synthase/RimK-type ligase-like ATP-grasp enzyme
MNMQNSKLKSDPTTVALIVNVLRHVAPQIGAEIIIEPEWGIFGQIIYPSGVKRYFRFSAFDINNMAAYELARDKGFARHFLQHMGYPIPKGQSFLSSCWAAKLNRPDRGGVYNAWRGAKKIGLPVFVKPNSRSQGIGVSKARDWKTFRRATTEAFKHDRIIVVEQAVRGHDYRLVVLDGEIISAYERIPLTVIGNGISSVRELLIIKQQEFKNAGRDTKLKLDDVRMMDNLRGQGLSMESIPENNQAIQLLDNANLSTGGASIDVTEKVHPDFKEFAVKVTRDMGLRLAGVDLMVNGDITSAPIEGNYWLLEINSAPGLDHYASMGEKQQKIVDDLYLRLLIAMERSTAPVQAPKVNADRGCHKFYVMAYRFVASAKPQ